jgi:hypothetical protein
MFVHLHVTCGHYIKLEFAFDICAKCFLVVFIFLYNYIVLLNSWLL